MKRIDRKDEIDKKEVGSRIRDIRLDLGETAEKFGEHFDPPANRGLVSGWENGRYLPSPDRLKKIAEIRGITPQELLRGKNIFKLSDLYFLAEKEDLGKAFKYIRLIRHSSIEEVVQNMNERDVFRRSTPKVEMTITKLEAIERGDIKPTLDEIKRFVRIQHYHQYEIRDILRNKMIFYFDKDITYSILVEFFGDIFDKEKVFNLVDTMNLAPVMGTTPLIVKKIYDYMDNEGSFTDYQVYKNFFLDGITKDINSINKTSDLDEVIELSDTLRNLYIQGYLGITAYEKVYQDK